MYDCRTRPHSRHPRPAPRETCRRFHESRIYVASWIFDGALVVSELRQHGFQRDIGGALAANPVSSAQPGGHVETIGPTLANRLHAGVYGIRAEKGERLRLSVFAAPLDALRVLRHTDADSSERRFPGCKAYG